MRREILTPFQKLLPSFMQAPLHQTCYAITFLEPILKLNFQQFNATSQPEQPKYL